MDRLLFLVARGQPDLWDQLNKEFSHDDVSVVVDRRRGERRRRDAEHAEDRRSADRRSHADIDQEVQARGFSVIRLEPGERVRREGDPRAVRIALAYIQERFRHCTTVTSWDPELNGQSFVIFNEFGRPAHRVLFDKEFLDHYGKSMADRIPSLLDEWRLTDHLEVSQTGLVVVSSYGVHLTAG